MEQSDLTAESFAKNPKLESYQHEHRLLLDAIEPLQKERKSIDNRLRKMNSRLHSIGSAIYDLKHNGQVPEITDHAMIRYLERVEGWDINELKLKVAKHRQAVKVGNVIVTVNPKEEDA